MCVFGCLWVCYHDNSKLRASIFTKLDLGPIGNGSDHLQLIKFWPSCTFGKGVCGGAKNFGSLQPARSVCDSLSAFLIYVVIPLLYLVFMCLQNADFSLE